MNNELEQRRENVFSMMRDNSVAVIFSGVSKISTEDEFYPFQVNNSFFYLTNITQEHSALIMIKGLGEKKCYLFVDEYNELKEKWTGRRLTFDEAEQLSGLYNVYSSDNFDNMLNLALTNENNQYGKIETLYLDLTPELKIEDSKSTQTFQEEMEAKYPQLQTMDIKPIITSLRMVKSAYEVEQIRDAISATNLGINKLILSLRPGIMEYELADIFEFFGRGHNRSKLAFDTIVASGKNATCLHYPSQNCAVRGEDLVVFDLGYKSNGYCADISRTFPVSGTFTGKGKLIYEAVLNCNKAVIEYARPGLTIKDLQEFAKTFLKNECVRLSLLKDEDDIQKVYYHNVSHHLGLDTHDASNREKPLEEGNVITVEPGLYFADLGIGVRIEDDILIRNDKVEILSFGIPKEINDIEKLFRTKGNH